MVEIVCSNCSELTAAKSSVRVEEVAHEGTPDIGLELTTTEEKPHKV